MNVNKCESDVGKCITVLHRGPRPHHRTKKQSDMPCKWTAAIELSVYIEKVIESSRYGATASCGTHVIHLQRASRIYQVWDQSAIVPGSVSVFVRVSRCLCICSVAYMCETYAPMRRRNKLISWALEECSWGGEGGRLFTPLDVDGVWGEKGGEAKVLSQCSIGVLQKHHPLGRA